MRVYVVSTGRCGSLSLANWFQGFTSCLMEPNGRTALLLYAHRIQNGRASAEAAIVDHLNSYDPPHVLVDHETTLCVDTIEDNIDGDNRYIWLIRNGYDCVSSFMAWKWYRDERDRPLMDVYAHNRICAYWVGEATYREWSQWSNFRRSCWYWSWANRYIETQLARVPDDRKFFLRLEDWSPEVAIKLCRFTDLDEPDDLSLPKGHAGVWNELRPKWDKDEIAVFDHHCGKEMARWYPERKMP